MHAMNRRPSASPCFPVARCICMLQAVPVVGKSPSRVSPTHLLCCKAASLIARAAGDKQQSSLAGGGDRVGGRRGTLDARVGFLETFFTFVLGGLLRAGVSGEDTFYFGGRGCMFVWGRARWEVPLHVWGTANNVAILAKVLGCGVDPCEGSGDGGLVMCVATCVVAASRGKLPSTFETMSVVVVQMMTMMINSISTTLLLPLLLLLLLQVMHLALLVH
jgi:hypothetical protein